MPGPAWASKPKAKSAAQSSRPIKSTRSSWPWPPLTPCSCIVFQRTAGWKLLPKFSTARSLSFSTSRKIACTCRKPSCTPCSDPSSVVHVIAMIGDVGQQEDLEAARKKALATGASTAYVEDLREEFVRDYIWPTLRAGAVYEHTYLLGTSMARPILGKRQAEIALQLGADGLSHGCTGKGNDQVRFELAYKAIAPNVQIIAPWREWDIDSREDAIAYAAKHNVPVEQSKKNIYSRDRNIWHLSHEGGELEDPANSPSEAMWQWTASPEKAPDRAEEVEIGFEAGTPVSVNGAKLGPVDLLNALNEIAAKHGIGRTDIVENRLVGMKSRGAYETPGGTLLVKAHQELERLTVDRETSHFQQALSDR